MLRFRGIAGSADAVRHYAVREIQPVTLRTLLLTPTPNSPAALLASARYAHSELPTRLARRIQAFRHLPFIVGTNPYIKSVHDDYIESFNAIIAFSEIASVEQDERFTRVLVELTERHKDTVPKLARGFLESRGYVAPGMVARFLDELIHSRIGVRLIAEHHVALHGVSRACSDGDFAASNYIGLVHTRLRPAALLRDVVEYVRDICEVNYGRAPRAIFTGQVDTILAYVPVHLEYIACELLKNAYRATVEHAMRQNSVADDELPPVEITVSKGSEQVGIRIRDRGGGIRPEDVDSVFDYSYTTVSDDPSSPSSSLSNDLAAGGAGGGIFSTQTRMAVQAGSGGPMAGLGYGLPMAQIYAQYFGGRLELVSIDGLGCDVFLRVPNINQETDKEI